MAQDSESTRRRTSAGKPGWLRVTPRQLLLVVVLGAVFAVMLLVQVSNRSRKLQQARAKAAAKTPAPPPAPAQPPAPAPVAKRLPKKAWSRLSLEDSCRHDPFVSLSLPRAQGTQATGGPGAEPQRASARSAARPRQRAVQAIVEGRSGAAAIIDGQVVSVGDAMEGFRVISIDKEGVLLAPIQKESDL